MQQPEPKKRGRPRKVIPTPSPHVLTPEERAKGDRALSLIILGLYTIGKKEFEKLVAQKRPDNYQI